MPSVPVTSAQIFQQVRESWASWDHPLQNHEHLSWIWPRRNETRLWANRSHEHWFILISWLTWRARTCLAQRLCKHEIRISTVIFLLRRRPINSLCKQEIDSIHNVIWLLLRRYPFKSTLTRCIRLQNYHDVSENRAIRSTISHYCKNIESKTRSRGNVRQQRQ